MPRDANNFLEIEDAPGTVDNYRLFRVDGREMLSTPFEFRLSLRSNGEIPAPKDWIGSSITFVMGASDPDYFRKINGVCSRFEHAYQKGQYVEFVIDVTPSMLITRLRRDSRIWLKKTAKEIINEILGEHGIVFDDTKVKHVTDVREYCIQHQENDFDFINRLMEEEGIFYYFRYDQGAGRYRHKMYLADDPAGYFDDPLVTKLSFRQDHLLRGMRTIEKAETHATAAWITHDYNFKTPKSLQPIKTPTRLSWAEAGTHYYDWPGGYDNTNSGNRHSKLSMEESEATNLVLEGTGSYLAFTPGARFEIDDNRLTAKEKRIAIRSVIHSAWDPVGLDEGGEPTYQQQFTAVPSHESYRPPSITPPAIVRGPQTAVVTDHVDPEGFGRIQVRFHWDRFGANTFWVRVAQQWAGRSMGSQFVPRTGMEVLIDFLDGEADRPVVVGCLYNGDSPFPFKLSDNLSQSGWRSETYPSGGGVTQEFMFEDKPGGEEIYTYAGRNYRRVVDNDETVDIKGLLKKHVVKDSSYKYDQNVDTNIDKKKTLHVGDNSETKIDKTMKMDIGQDAEFKVKQTAKVEINDSIEITGNTTGTMKVTGPLTIESTAKLTLKVGGNTIELTPAGIAITGTIVRINS